MELVPAHVSSTSTPGVRSTTLSTAAWRDPSTRLEDLSLLRGVRASALMARCGRLLAKPPRGCQYEMNAEQSGALYATSHEVDSIDWFISHSWRDSRWSKYTAIGWLLNYKASLMFANLLSLMWILIQSFHAPLSHRTNLSLGIILGHNDTVCERIDCQREIYSAHVKNIYVMAFILCIFLRTSRTSCTREATFFLDKACIHQTDPERKARGILSLGGFLRKSHRMLVLWSPNYFDRLWCNYELACFGALAGIDKVDVIPLWVPTFAMALLTHHCFKDFLIRRFRHSYVTQALALPIFCVPFLRAAWARAEMRQQLMGFDWSRAECFCCDVGHKLPGTGVRIPCDRVFVERNVTNWFCEFSTVEETGIQTFERYVRDHVGSKARRLVGATVIPFSVVAAYAQMLALGCLEEYVINPHVWKHSMLREVVEFSVELLQCLIFQGIVDCKPVPSKRSCCSLVCDILLGSAILITHALLRKYLITSVERDFVVEGNLWAFSRLCVCLVVAIASLYRVVS